MEKKKCAMLIMNELFDPKKDQARLDTVKVDSYIMTVRNPEEAVALAKKLKEDGFGAIEVCGAFGPELAQKMYEATDCTIPVGYVVIPAEQLPAAIKFWTKD